MLGTKKSAVDLFRSHLHQILNMNHELVILSKEIKWKWIEKQLAPFYSDTGRPSVPIRSMVGLLILKQLYNESDESVVDRWIENPYWQYFTGEEYMQHKGPFDPTDFVHFRDRVGEAGMEKIVSLTVMLHKGVEEEKIVQIDTTVQEKNITFPTDVKLKCRIMEYCRVIAHHCNIDLRQSYVRKQKELMRMSYNGKHPSRAKQARRAKKKLHTICGRLIRDVERKLTAAELKNYGHYLELYHRVHKQKRQDKNKIYSLHEPQVQCISKGKAHKRYEFGNKVSIAKTQDSGVIVGVKSFATNIYDGHTIAQVVDQIQRIMKPWGGAKIEEAVVDRGYRGINEYEGIRINRPGKAKKTDTNYQKRKKRIKFRKRASIEPVIGHLKQDHRMLRNYLKGTQGDAINALLAGSAFNVKKRLNQLKKAALALLLRRVGAFTKHYRIIQCRLQEIQALRRRYNRFVVGSF